MKGSRAAISGAFCWRRWPDLAFLHCVQLAPYQLAISFWKAICQLKTRMGAWLQVTPERDRLASAVHALNEAVLGKARSQARSLASGPLPANGEIETVCLLNNTFSISKSVCERVVEKRRNVLFNTLLGLPQTCLSEKSVKSAICALFAGIVMDAANVSRKYSDIS